MAAKRSCESLEENMTHPTACVEEVTANKQISQHISNCSHEIVEAKKITKLIGQTCLGLHTQDCICLVNKSMDGRSSSAVNYQRSGTTTDENNCQTQEAKMAQTTTTFEHQPIPKGQESKSFVESKHKERKKCRIQGGWSDDQGRMRRGSSGRGSRSQRPRGPGISGHGQRSYEERENRGSRYEANKPRRGLPHKSAYPTWQENHLPNKAHQPDYVDAGEEVYEEEYKQRPGGYRQPNNTRYTYDYTAPENVHVDQKAPIKEKEIDVDGEFVLSGKPSGESKIIFSKHFLEEAYAQNAFDQLVEEINWKRRLITKPSGGTYYEPRKTHWFGELPYSYSRVTMESCDEWPTLVLELKKRIEEYTANTYNSVLCNLYEDGHDGVQWHSDDEFSLGVNPVIASLSLGTTRKFEMRKKPDLDYCEYDDYSQSEKYFVHLNSGSLLVMMGCTQADWQHRVPKEYHDREGRINLTFRTIHPDKRTSHQH